MPRIYPNTFISTLTVLCMLSLATGFAQAENASISDAAQPVASAAEEPGAKEAIAVVEKLNGVLLDTMKRAKDLGYQGRVENLGPAMTEAFDLEFMASKSVGRYWRTLEKKEQARWLDAFRRFSTANYAGRFTGYDGETFEIVGDEAAARDTRMVRTKLVRPGNDDIELNYRLMERDGRWRIIDVYMNGTVSELALRRSEYSSALKRDGFESLIAAVETKIAELAEESTS